MRSSQRGNAMVYILVGIVLFAALAYTLMRGSNSGQGNMSAQQAKIQSSEIMNYAQSVENAIDTLRRKGCSENELSFDYDIPGTTGYENPNSPPDYSCHVFRPEGGSITYKESPISGRSWAFITSRVVEVGEDKSWCSETITTPCIDLVLILGGLSVETCESLHNMIQGPIPTFTQDNGAAYDTAGTKFIGNFSVSTPDIEMVGGTNKASGCITGTDNIRYFYHTILAR